MNAHFSTRKEGEETARPLVRQFTEARPALPVPLRVHPQERSSLPYCAVDRKAGLRPIPMKKVSIINFKGGVGKTTLSLHLATYLASLQQKVLVIDVDHQSSLSIIILGAKLWEKCVNEQRTVNRVFQSFCNRKVPMPKDELVIKNAIGE